MSLLRNPQKTISQVFKSLKINGHFEGDLSEKDFSEGTQVYLLKTGRRRGERFG